MHEYSIVQALYDSVMTHASARGAAGTVQEVRVRIGALSGVDGGLLDTAWRTFRVRTPCENAEMVIETVAPAWECAACRLAAPALGIRRCMICGGPLHLAEGDEIVLDRIVMEVP
jgi:hydrogenase nickel incorporation protein HypA/HybF